MSSRPRRPTVKNAKVEGQSRANLIEMLRSRTDAELLEARRQIAEDGVVLQLPLASRVEFDA